MNYDIEIEAIYQWLLTANPVAAISDNEITITDQGIVPTIDTYFKEKCNSEVQRGDWTVKLTKSGIRSSIHHGYGRVKINAFALVSDIIKQGRILDFQQNWKNRGYDSYTITAPVKIGSMEYIGEVIINCGKDNNKVFYLHEVEVKTKLLDACTTGMDTCASDGASKLRIARLVDFVKSESLKK
jgi:hypothetical protein